MFVNRTHKVAATLGALALGACTDPTQNTDLRPEGPPDVLAVLVMTDAGGHLVEKATYCRPNDEKRPGLVGLPDFTTQQVCPEMLSEGATEVKTAYPDGWYVRIMFDELLDPSIEELSEIIDSDGEPTGTFEGSIAGTHPVNLECMSISGSMINIDYDGYYSPSGNAVTWPLGPSLVIKPNTPKLIATNTACRISINDNVLDKSGEVVPANQRGPFTFSVAPIQAIFIDPPDDPDFEHPIPAKQLFFDNAYMQFNTFVDSSSLCPENGNDFFGMCDSEIVQYRALDGAVEGKCNSTLLGCLTMADCDATMGDTLCGKGYCDTNGDTCNVLADCTLGGDTNCGFNYVYSYEPFGLSDTEFGLGPMMPLRVEQKYTFAIPAGVKLVDRCGKETTFGEPSAEDNTLTHFITDKFDLVAPNIVTGETAAGTKKLQFNFTNALDGGDLTVSAIIGLGGIPAISMAGNIEDGEWTLSPMPFLNATTPMTQSTTMIAATDVSGQVMVRGHLQMNTEYTYTLKQGATVFDPYGAMWMNPEDLVIRWKTAPSILVTSFGLRDSLQNISATDGGTVVKTTPTTKSDIRIGFNQGMDPTTIGLDDVLVEPAPPADLAVQAQSGCGTTSTSCTLRLRGTFSPGTYKITLKLGAGFKDLFGVDYTQAKNQTITVTVEDPPPPDPACL